MSTKHPTTEEETRRLVRFFRNHQGQFAVGLARGPLGARRTGILDDVARGLHDLGITPRTIDFSNQEVDSLYDRLVPQEGPTSVQHHPLIVQGLESTIFGADGDRFLRVLNLERDRFRRNIHFPVLFWLTPAAADRLQTEAHDFYDYWSGLFDFDERDDRAGMFVSLPFQTDQFHPVAPAPIPDEAEKRYLREEVSRHETILEGLRPIEAIADERRRQQAVDVLRALARAEGRLGQIDAAQEHIETMLTLMPRLTPPASTTSGTVSEAHIEPPPREAIEAFETYARWLKDQLEHHNAALVMALIAEQKEMLMDAAVSAVRRKMYDAADELLQPLERYWRAMGEFDAIEALVDDIQRLLVSPTGAPPNADSDAGIFWAKMEVTRINQWYNNGRLDDAEEAYLQLAATLEASPNPESQKHLAVVYSQLSAVAFEQGDWDSSEAWVRKAIGIAERRRDLLFLGNYYNNLSQVFSARGRLDEAATWLKEAIRLDNAQNNQSSLAYRYNNLGRLERERGNLSEAARWLQMAIELAEERGDRPALAVFYTSKSVLELDLGHLDDAEDLLDRAIEIAVKHDNRPARATIYTNMGHIKRMRGELDEAEQLLKRAWLEVAALPYSRKRQEVGSAYVRILIERDKPNEAEAVRAQFEPDVEEGKLSRGNGHETQ